MISKSFILIRILFLHTLTKSPTRAQEPIMSVSFLKHPRFSGVLASAAAACFLLTSLGYAPDVSAAAGKKSATQAKTSAEKKSVAKRKDASVRKTVSSKTSRAGKTVASRAESRRNVADSKANRTVLVRKVAIVNGKRRVVTTRVQQAAPMRAAFTPAAPVRPSLGEALGLRDTQDALELRSSVALVMDQNTNEVLFQKNPLAVLPIASITKLMTALVVMDARQPMDEVLEVAEDDRDFEKNTGSRLQFGLRLPRHEFMLLALMSSENRAASVLGRHYPGGLPAFVQAMNRKARELGMTDSRFVDSSGLSSRNVSSAADLAKLVVAAHRNPQIRAYSTQTEHDIVALNGRTLRYVNTNRLVRGGDWEIGLQKTGFISEAGRCLVMQAKVQGRDVVMVFLDSAGKLSRFADAVRVRDWLEHAPDRHAPLTHSPHSPQQVLSGMVPRGT